MRIAIDDFGTGYSSLAHLREMPIDCLKIDRAFISEIAGGQGGMFAETIIALGEAFGVGIVAEGVETPEQAGFCAGWAALSPRATLTRSRCHGELMQWQARHSARAGRHSPKSRAVSPEDEAVLVAPSV